MLRSLVGVRSVTFDFGNTLVRVDRATLGDVVASMAGRVVAGRGPADRDAFIGAWAEEQARQFREEVPALREVELPQRLVRVLARLRGMAPPPSKDRWDDVAAARWSAADEIDDGIEAYSTAFLERVAPAPEASAVLARLRELGFTLAILSNWPSAVTVDRFVERAGWNELFSAVVVSQRIGTIKPNPVIFRAAEAALGADPSVILHVGDDWAQDVVGAKSAGWRAAYLRDRQGDTPLPTSRPDEGVRADLVIDELSELIPALT